MSARYIVGDAFDLIDALEDGSVDCVITSPPYFKQRRYLPDGHPEAHKEIGQEQTPAESLGTLLRLMDALWPKLSDDATYWVNLGDKHAGSGGAGGDYGDDGLRSGQPRYGRVDGGDGWPLDQSVCWLPHLFGASLAYGRNLLSGEPHRQWVTRPAVTWCKPNPMPGSTGRKFKTATELVVYGGKHQAHYFDLDSVREPAPPENMRGTRNQTGPKQRLAAATGESRNTPVRFTKRTVNPAGKAPLNYWVVESEPYEGAHFAVMPSGLVVKPVITGCPPGGLVLDPFGGSGTTAAVCVGHGRNCLLFDLDERNAELARQRVGMFLDVSHGDGLLPVPASPQTRGGAHAGV
jgi:DNA modification methylase